MSSYERSIIFISIIITEDYIIFVILFVSQCADNNWKREKCKHQSYGKIEGKGASHFPSFRSYALYIEQKRAFQLCMIAIIKEGKSYDRKCSTAM